MPARTSFSSPQTVEPLAIGRGLREPPSVVDERRRLGRRRPDRVCAKCRSDFRHEAHRPRRPRKRQARSGVGLHQGHGQRKRIRTELVATSRFAGSKTTCGPLFRKRSLHFCTTSERRMALTCSTFHITTFHTSRLFSTHPAFGPTIIQPVAFAESAAWSMSRVPSCR
jgi:hypothetical protein